MMKRKTSWLPITHFWIRKNSTIGAFSTFRVKTLVEEGKIIGQTDLDLSWGKDYLLVMTDGRFTALLPEEIQVSSVVTEAVFDQEAVRAPVQKGDKVGYLKLCWPGKRSDVSIWWLANSRNERVAVLPGLCKKNQRILLVQVRSDFCGAAHHPVRGAGSDTEPQPAPVSKRSGTAADYSQQIKSPLRGKPMDEGYLLVVFGGTKGCKRWAGKID